MFGLLMCRIGDVTFERGGVWGGGRRVFTCCDGHQDGSPRPQDKVIVQGHDERRASGKGERAGGRCASSLL